jgi:2-dehydropantoate 2-reductase
MSKHPSINKVAVVGVGAIGGVFAAWLAKLPAGQIQLNALARGETLRTLQSKGLT